jgi:hypothetical protein
MTWYFYLNYRIYKFYQRKNESIPAFFSFSATAVLLGFNIFSLIGLSGFVFSAVHNFIFSLNKYSVLVLFAIVGLFNYFTLYRNKFYEEVFDDFYKHEEKYEAWNLSILVYLALSVVLLLCTLVIADLRNHGRL